MSIGIKGLTIAAHVYMYVLYFTCTVHFVFLFSLRKVCEDFESFLGPPPPTRLIMAIDNRLRKQFTDQHGKFQKVNANYMYLYFMITYSTCIAGIYYVF